KEARSGRVERVSGALIPGEGSSVSGASYSFVDHSAINGVHYLYMLEDYDLGGFNTIHPPKSAIPNPPSPPIQLLEPAYEAQAGQVIIFRWNADQRAPVNVRISADPTFPPESTMVLSTGAGASRRLSPKERAQVREMASSGVGGVYWTVTGRGPRGSLLESQTWFLAVEP
ncbi:MAG TPA: hypothetical protein VNI57_04375, partial [Candidatus Saccharimonadales bacterium]|nr:hypothetical protein [Candidatus Saccharimonadales bacterium]